MPFTIKSVKSADTALFHIGSFAFLHFSLNWNFYKIWFKSYSCQIFFPLNPFFTAILLTKIVFLLGYFIILLLLVSLFENFNIADGRGSLKGTV